jgi:hypothetical protein
MFAAFQKPSVHILPGIKRCMKVAVGSNVDSFLQRENFEEEDLGQSEKTQAAACPTCGVPREEWSFDNVSICGKCGIVK